MMLYSQQGKSKLTTTEKFQAMADYLNEEGITTNKINGLQEHLIYGFIRQCEMVCGTIPIDINHICIMFYGKLCQFNYSHDYDKNGICYSLGSRFGSNKWDNPSKLGLVSLSSTGWEEGSISDFVGRQGVMSYAEHKEYSWIAIDFGSNIKIKVNCYTLRHSNAHKGFYLRNWNFEGSNDGKEWTIIKKHKNDKTFKKKGQAHTWTMNNCNKYYQHFRIIMTNTDSSGCWYMMGTGFEIYGYLTGNK
eukprot:452232_1